MSGFFVDKWLIPADSVTVTPMEKPVSFEEAMGHMLRDLYVTPVSFKEDVESDKAYTLKDLNGAPEFIKTVKDWGEFDEFIKSSKFEDNVGYIILKSDSGQYFGRIGSSWIDISESYKDFIKENK